MGEEAIRLTEGVNTCEGLVARARAESLVSACAWVDDPIGAERLATSALDLFDRALGSDCLKDRADLFEALWESARLNCSLSRFEEAARLCKQALQTAPNRDRELAGLIELGTIYRESGQLTEARETFTRAIGFRDTVLHGLARPYFELGLTERALGKTAEARAKVRRAIGILESAPNFQATDLADYLRVHGNISYDLGDTEAALRSFRAAVEHYPATDPFHWSSLVWLAQCQADLRQFEAARESAEQVKESLFASSDDRGFATELLQELPGNTRTDGTTPSVH